MPKLPVLKARELLKLLNKLGFYKHHQVGSHIQLKHSNGRRTTVPYHASHEIKRGTLKSIIDDLNISVDEFVNLVKQKK